MSDSIHSLLPAVGVAGSATRGCASMRTGARSASRPAASSFAKPPVRRLAAVLIADVAGYSRLMEQDETGTHLRLRDLRSELIEPAIEQHGGRIIRCAGDGLLVQFSSATDALRCAVEIQREMAQRNAQVPAAAQIRFRIGVNVADILFDDEDIAGSGVNLAARLETLAEPGGICISRALRDLIQEDLKVEYLDAGNRRVKNISRPVRVYRVLAEAPMPSALQRAAAGGLAGTLGRWIALASSAAVVAALAVTVSGRADLHPTLQEAAAAAVSLQRASRPRA